MFQFLDGAIGRMGLNQTIGVHSMFQFLDGAIGSFFVGISRSVSP